MKLAPYFQRATFWSLLWRFLRTYQQSNTFIFSFWTNNKCVSPTMKFDIDADQLFLAAIVNIDHDDNYSLYRNRFIIGYKCGFYESNFDILIARNKRSNWWRVLFQQKLHWRRKRAFGRLFHYSSIHLWLYIVWSVVVCPKDTFTLQERAKTTKL